MILQSAVISLYLQHELGRRHLDEVSAVEAAKWLDRAGLLRDSQGNPGLPLREFLRRRAILGQRQEESGRWFVERVRISKVDFEWHRWETRGRSRSYRPVAETAAARGEEEAVARSRRLAGEKAAITRKRRAAARKAVRTRRRQAAARKRASGRKSRTR